MTQISLVGGNKIETSSFESVAGSETRGRLDFRSGEMARLPSFGVSMNESHLTANDEGEVCLSK
jgi:hypothetical protein